MKARNQRMHNLLNKLSNLQTKSEILMEASFIEPRVDVDVFLTTLETLLADIAQIKQLQKRKPQKKINWHKPTDFSEFIAWLRQEKFPQVDQLVIKKTDEGHGIFASKDVKEGDEILKVPRKFMITRETAEGSSLKTLITEDKFVSQLPSLQISLFLIVEKNNPKSHWAPYINILPETFTTPLFWSFSELKELIGSSIMWDVIKVIASAVKQYVTVYSILPNYPNCGLNQVNFTWELFSWALSIVMSRQNRIPSSQVNQGSTIGLVPVYDLYNHEEGTITSYFDVETNELRVSAIRDFKKNQQIKIFYGNRSNNELFLYQGFVYDKNKNDYVSYVLQLDPKSPVYEKQKELLKAHGIAESWRSQIKPDEIPEKLIQFLRVHSLTLEDIDQGHLAFEPNGIVSLNNELKAYYSFLVPCKLIFMKYPTTIEQDLEKLKKSGLSPHVVLATRLLIAEKQYLVKTLRVLDEKIQSIRSKIQKQKEDQRKPDAIVDPDNNHVQKQIDGLGKENPVAVDVTGQ